MKETLHLPHELIVQILLRLPVKSLVRFKCVCKSWFSLISDSCFANSHFQLTAATGEPRIMFKSNFFHEFRSIDIETSLNHYSTSLNLDFLHPLFQSDCREFRIEMKSSCRGFIFLNCSSIHSSKLYLWNLSTGVHKQIPLPPVVSNLDPDDIFYLYGFGYDQSTDDYLVVSVLCDLSNDFADISSHLNIFSLRANTWKQFECTALSNYSHFPYLDDSFYEERVGFLCNGALHWLAADDDLNKYVILVFHLMEREVLEMSFPNDFDQESMDCDLWVFGEFLSLWAMEYRSFVNIWVMKEYGVHSSWTKTLVLSIVAIPTRYFYPICCTRNGEIIGTDGGTGLVKYDDKGQLLEHYSYCNDPDESQVAVYIESLLSLPCDNEQA